MKKLFTIVMVCALLSSCGSDEKKVEGNVGNIKGDWLIEEAMGKSTSGGEKEAFISFGEDGKFNGNTTVNSFFGEYSVVVEGDSLKLSNIGMTRMVGPTMEIEDAIVKALGSYSTVNVSDSTAVMLDEKGEEVLKLRKK